MIRETQYSSFHLLNQEESTNWKTARVGAQLKEQVFLSSS